MKKLMILFFLTLQGLFGYNQIQDSTSTFKLSRFTVTDSEKNIIKDGIYDRPFISIPKSTTAIGGYIEGNTNYFAEDGVSEGFSMELRRFNIFLFSSVSSRIRFLSELEFEHGTEEIAIETAMLDFEINESLIFRAGILLPQIGIFNADHDSPKWELIDRPLSSTKIIPSTLAEIGFGLNGNFFPGNNVISYDFYIVNGLQDGIILNEEGKTFIPAGKSEESFEEDNNGIPMINAKVSLTNNKIGKIGISAYGGIYNRFKLEGEEVDMRRKLIMLAADFSTEIQKLQLRAEFVQANIDIPADIVEIYSNYQYGGFLEATYPIAAFEVLDYQHAQLLATIRAEMLDFNTGTFNATSEKIGDEITALAFAISFRPTPATVFKANYRYHWTTDILGNPPARLGGIQFGVASYF